MPPIEALVKEGEKDDAEKAVTYIFVTNLGGEFSKKQWVYYSPTDPKNPYDEGLLYHKNGDAGDAWDQAWAVIHLARADFKDKAQAIVKGLMNEKNLLWKGDNFGTVEKTAVGIVALHETSTYAEARKKAYDWLYNAWEKAGPGNKEKAVASLYSLWTSFYIGDKEKTKTCVDWIFKTYDTATDYLNDIDTKTQFICPTILSIQAFLSTYRLLQEEALLSWALALVDRLFHTSWFWDDALKAFNRQVILSADTGSTAVVTILLRWIIDEFSIGNSKGKNPAESSFSFDATLEADTSVNIKVRKDERNTFAVATYVGNPFGSLPAGKTGLKIVDITTDQPEDVTWPIEVWIYYDESELAAAGVDESTLELYSWDGTQWVKEEKTQVYADEDCLYAQLDHLSPKGLCGGPHGCPPVGGEILPINKLELLMPLIEVITTLFALALGIHLAVKKTVYSIAVIRRILTQTSEHLTHIARLIERTKNAGNVGNFLCF